MVAGPGEMPIQGVNLTIRRAWTMKLKPGAAEQYRAVHAAIWPEMLERMRAGGVRSFSIYRDGLTLLAYQEIEADDPAALEPDATIRRWWKTLEPLMECEPGGEPLRRELDEVFHYSAKAQDTGEFSSVRPLARLGEERERDRCDGAS